MYNASITVVQEYLRKGFDITKRPLEHSDWRIAPFQPGNECGIQSWPTVDIYTALSTQYNTWAMALPYYVPGLALIPRINKGGLAKFIELVKCEPQAEVLFVDVDNHRNGKKVPWDDELRADFEQKLQNCPSLQTVAYYTTKHGYRLVQLLDAPIPVSILERTLLAWHQQLAKDGIQADEKCRDWTRVYGLPSVVKNGERIQTFVDASRLAPIHIEPVEAQAVKKRAGAKRSPKIYGLPTFASSVPEGWEARIERLANALTKANGNWHELAMALAGSMLEQGIEPGLVPALVQSAFVATGVDTRPDDRLTAAKTTVERHSRGEVVIGTGLLFMQWPWVAYAVQQLREHAVKSPDRPRTKEEVYAALEEEIRTAPDGVTLIGAECGLGKTRAAIAVAIERAQKPGRLQTKTAISVDKNRLAMQIVDDIEALGGKVQRYFGPLSLKNPDGSPVCKMYDMAIRLQAGKQSVQKEFCNGRGRKKCEYFEGCLARDGVVGPDDARIVVGPHALMANLKAKAGTTGLMIIDEPPLAVETHNLSLVELRAREVHEGAFESAYAYKMRPLFRAFDDWAQESALDGQTYTLREILAVSRSAIRMDELETPLSDSVDEALRMAASACQDITTPPIQNTHIGMAKQNVKYAKELGMASCVYWLLHHIVNLLPEEGVSDSLFWVTDGYKGRSITAVTPNEMFASVLRREGATIVSDANIDMHVPGISGVVKYEPALKMFSAPDGAPIERTLFRVNGNRTQWFSHGKPIYESGLARAIKHAIEWANGESLGLITYKVVRDDLFAGRVPGVELPPGTILGHYGATRGNNDMKDVQCLATIGDPWPNLYSVENEAKFLKLEDAERLHTVRARAELEQAHGRLRVVHRTKPGRALHVGTVLPGGLGWSSTNIVHHDLMGRVAAPSNMTREEFSEIMDRVGAKDLAELLDCSVRMLYRYAKGESKISMGTAVVARNLIEKEAAE